MEVESRRADSSIMIMTFRGLARTSAPTRSTVFDVSDRIGNRLALFIASSSPALRQGTRSLSPRYVLSTKRSNLALRGNGWMNATATVNAKTTAYALVSRGADPRAGPAYHLRIRKAITEPTNSGTTKAEIDSTSICALSMGNKLVALVTKKPNNRPVPVTPVLL